MVSKTDFQAVPAWNADLTGGKPMRWSPMDEVNLVAQIGDLKENHYKNTLILTALVELLAERGLIRRDEVLDKAYELDEALLKQALF